MKLGCYKNYLQIESLLHRHFKVKYLLAKLSLILLIDIIDLFNHYRGYLKLYDKKEFFYL